MIKIVSNSKFNAKVRFKNSVSTVLVPEYLLSFYLEQIKKFKGLNRYFEYLINQYKPFHQTGQLPEIVDDKIEYQQKGLKLRKFNFRAYPGNWYEFGLIAQTWNISRCLLFVTLMRMDRAKFGQFLRKKFKLSGKTIKRFFQKRIFLIKGYFPFPGKPDGQMAFLHNVKLKI